MPQARRFSRRVDQALRSGGFYPITGVPWRRFVAPCERFLPISDRVTGLPPYLIKCLGCSQIKDVYCFYFERKNTPMLVGACMREQSSFDSSFRSAEVKRWLVES